MANLRFFLNLDVLCKEKLFLPINIFNKSAVASIKYLLIRVLCSFSNRFSCIFILIILRSIVLSEEISSNARKEVFLQVA